MKIARHATQTLLQQWAATPDQAAHLNNSDGNQATYNRATVAGKANEYGGFDFSGIPAGSRIDSITVRQTVRNSPDDTGDREPASQFALRISGDDRMIATYGTNTDGERVTQEATLPPGAITADELKAGLLTLRKTTAYRSKGSGIEDPPIPTAP